MSGKAELVEFGDAELPPNESKTDMTTRKKCSLIKVASSNPCLAPILTVFCGTVNGVGENILLIGLSCAAVRSNRLVGSVPFEEDANSSRAVEGRFEADEPMRHR